MAKQSAQLAQWAGPLVRTALRTPRPPNDIGNVAMSLASSLHSARLVCRMELKHSIMSWSCLLAKPSTASGSTHRNEYVALAAAPRNGQAPTRGIRFNIVWCSPIGVPDILMPCSSGGTLVLLQTRASGSRSRAALVALRLGSRFWSSPRGC